MGLFDRFKRQLLEVIEWTDSSKDTLVYRYPLTDRDEIMNSSTLVVRPSQTAVFVHKGQVADVFGPGTYKLSTENIPFLTKLLSLPTGFNSRIKAEVYFVNTKQFTAQKWGTQNPIMMRDNEFGNVRLKAFGIYSFKVDDVKIFMKELFGTNEIYTVADIQEHLKPMLLQGFADTVAESKINALDLAANYKEFSNEVCEYVAQDFLKIGLKLSKFIIENISLPEDVEKALDERTKLGVLEDKMGTYTKYQAAQAMRDAAQNPSGGNLAGLGVGIGAGGALGHVFADNISMENPAPKTPVETCDKCGAKVKASAKFCGECGAKRGLTCSKCGSSVSKNAKFCAECGNKLVKECAKCGAQLKSNSKFCGECGEKVK